MPQFARDAIVVCIGGRNAPRNRTLHTPTQETTCPATTVPAHQNCIHCWRFTLAVELEAQTNNPHRINTHTLNTCTVSWTWHRTHGFHAWHATQMLCIGRRNTTTSRNLFTSCTTTHRNPWYQLRFVFPNRTNWPWMEFAHMSCASQLS